MQENYTWIRSIDSHSRWKLKVRIAHMLDEQYPNNQKKNTFIDKNVKGVYRCIIYIHMVEGDWCLPLCVALGRTSLGPDTFWNAALKIIYRTSIKSGTYSRSYTTTVVMIFFWVSMNSSWVFILWLTVLFIYCSVCIAERRLPPMQRTTVTWDERTPRRDRASVPCVGRPSPSRMNSSSTWTCTVVRMPRQP